MFVCRSVVCTDVYIQITHVMRPNRIIMIASGAVSHFGLGSSVLHLQP